MAAQNPEQDVELETDGHRTRFKQHKYESFSHRIAKFRVDAVSRLSGQQQEGGELTATRSYFYEDLERWQDLNTSLRFTNFAREVAPLCNSLPQVLHHESAIVELLVKYIDMKDHLALEPLLSLVVQLARDLEGQFEKHFSCLVNLVSSLAAHHPSIDVIEWSFSCLACLFKFLSKLLVPDLRPTYDLMVPLLGREQQKSFVLQFAAEAMAHLTRKAAAKYPRNETPLRILVEHVMKDLGSCQGTQSHIPYQQGVISLFSSSVKGIRGMAHSCALTVLRCVAETALSDAPETRAAAEEVLIGVVASLVHHAEVDENHPVILLLRHALEEACNTDQQYVFKIAADVLCTTVAIRNGSKIVAWCPIIDNVKSLLGQSITKKVQWDKNTTWLVLTAAALVLQSSPMNVVTPQLRSITFQLVADPLSACFLPFCSLFAELGQDRFKDLIAPYFERFLIDHWHECELEICTLVPKLVELGCLAKQNQAGLPVTCPPALQDAISEAFEALAASADESTFMNVRPVISAQKAYGYTTILRSMSITRQTGDRVRNSLATLLQKTLRGTAYSNDIVLFAKGTGFVCFIELSTSAQASEVLPWPSLRTSGLSFSESFLFLQGLLGYTKAVSESLKADYEFCTYLGQVLSRNLSTVSRTIRVLSLRVLQQLYSIQYSENSKVLELATTIEDTPLHLNTARTISMHIRTLASIYAQESARPMIKASLPRYYCGLLTHRFSQLDAEIYTALAKITGPEQEEELADVLFSWLEELPSHASQHQSAQPIANCKAEGGLEDPGVMRLRARLEKVRHEMDDPDNALYQAFVYAHEPAPTRNPSSRELGFQIFQHLPRIAERQSCRLIRFFLPTIDSERQALADEVEDDSSTSGYVDVDHIIRLTKREQRAFIELFSKFKNPRALYRSSDVYSALLGYLTNGDTDLQKAALEAIFAWKNPKILPHKERLHGLLDDVNFVDAMNGLIHGSQVEDLAQFEEFDELMPLVLRLLYGRAIARKGTKSQNRSMEDKRRLILTALAETSTENIGYFIDLAVGSPGKFHIFDETDEHDICEDRLRLRKDMGTLKMIESMVRVMGRKLTPLARRILEPVTYCLAQATQYSVDGDYLGLREPAGGSFSSTLKQIRHTGYQCLNALFIACPEFDWQPYMQTLFRKVIDPRVDKLPFQTAQSPLGIFQLFVTWSRSEKMLLYLSDYNQELLPKITECLIIPSAKSSVKLAVFEILTNITSNLGEQADCSRTIQDRIVNRLIRPNQSTLMTRLGLTLRSNLNKNVFQSGVSVLARLAPYITDVPEFQSLLDTMLFLLGQPPRLVDVKTKMTLLQCLRDFLPLADVSNRTGLQRSVLQTISPLFSYFKDRTSRQGLSKIVEVLSHTDTSLEDVSQLCLDLNSFVTGRLDEPDFNRRLKAFDAVCTGRLDHVPAQLWRPILYNLLFFLGDNEEFALRKSASCALRHFLDASLLDKNESSHLELITHIIIPAVHRGTQKESEAVRTEYVMIMAHVVRTFPGLDEVNGLDVLLAGGDEEASFFNNILHIQQHRRLRALKRLSTHAMKGQLNTRSIRHFLMPLVEHFIFQQKVDETLHNLGAEAVATFGVLIQWIEWSHCKSYLRNFIQHFKRTTEPENVFVKLLGVVTDAVAKAAEQKRKRVIEGSSELQHPTDNTQLETGGIEEEGYSTVESTPETLLSSTVPLENRLATELTSRAFLPLLSTFLRNKEDSFVSVRVAIAVSYVKLVKLFPREQLSLHLPPILTDLSHILRSRAAESRDMTGNALVEIATIMGPNCFAFILTEMQGALKRGYQLHVLSYTLHSLLVATIAELTPGDLDYCLPQIIQIIIDDTFGTIGEEKDSEGYTTAMKEIKRGKSYGSMELIAKIATLDSLWSLVQPIQAMLQQSLNLTLLRKIDELLRRITLGISQNKAVQNQGLLVFSYSLLTRLSSDAQPLGAQKNEGGTRAFRHTAPSKGRLATDRRTYSNGHGYKLVRFSLDLLRNALQKQEALRSASNLAGLVPLLNDALLSDQQEVKLSVLRVVILIIRVPCSGIDRYLPMYISEAVQYIKSSSNTHSEFAQASIKLVTTILRDRPDIDIGSGRLNNQVVYLLQRLQPDIEEPSRQGAVFNFLRSVLSRRIMVPEVYEVLDTVASVMVTNYARETRELARGVYVNFLMDYPQGKDRLQKQMKFLIKNLDYKYPEGRRSVLEVIHSLLAKVRDSLVQEIVARFMIPLVMVLINDEDPECREMAGALVRVVFDRADEERAHVILSSLQAWTSQDEKPLLIRAAVQCYGMYLDSQPSEGQKLLPGFRTRLQEILEAACIDKETSDRELVHQSLCLALKCCRIYPGALLTVNSKDLWSSVAACLSIAHDQINLNSINLAGIYFADFARSYSDDLLGTLPLVGSGGLQLGPELMLMWMTRHLRVLESGPVNQDLATQVVRNLLFIGRCLGRNGLHYKPPSSAFGKATARVDAVQMGRAQDGEDTEGLVSLTAIKHLLIRLSAILRQDLGATSAATMASKTASLQLLAALCTHLSADILRPSLPTILLALHHLTDTSIPEPRSSDPDFPAAYQALRATSHEIRDLLQKALPVSELVSQHQQVQDLVRERREDRRRKRRIEAVTDPDRAQRQKKKKDVMKKAKRKEKAIEHQGKRRGW